jgi:3-hydroxyisobutyrate dehydrogenase-like beta-hydroxyacid dehydrogenase
MIGVIGVGDMGLPMAGHILAHGFDVIAYDLDPRRLSAAAARGAKPASGLSELAQAADIVVACLRTDEPMEAVTEELVAHGRPGQLIVVAGTHSLEFMRQLAALVEPSEMPTSACGSRHWPGATVDCNRIRVPQAAGGWRSGATGIDR